MGRLRTWAVRSVSETVSADQRTQSPNPQGMPLVERAGECPKKHVCSETPTTQRTRMTRPGRNDRRRPQTMGRTPHRAARLERPGTILSCTGSGATAAGLAELELDHHVTSVATDVTTRKRGPLPGPSRPGHRAVARLPILHPGLAENPFGPTWSPRVWMEDAPAPRPRGPGHSGSRHPETVRTRVGG